MRNFYPMYLVLAYLIFTLFLYVFGPVQFKTHNVLLFYTLFIFYLLSFFVGYLISFLLNKGSKVLYEYRTFSVLNFYLLFFFGTFVLLINYKNLMLNDSLIPYDFFNNLFRGINEPGLVYSERMSKISAGYSSNSRLFNILLLFISFTKLLFIFYFVYFWGELNFRKKTICYLFSLLFLSCGISSGTNSFVFIFFIFLFFSLLVRYLIFSPQKLKKALSYLGVGMLLPIFSFGYIMSQRGGGFDYFKSTSPLGDISVVISSFDNEGFWGFLFYSLVWLNYYLVQGYYGFSLILSEHFEWTYGFGNSAFLQRQFEMITGNSITNNTFQSKVSDVWHIEAQWHSFFGQFANDVGLLGVGLVMFLLGYLLSKLWLSVRYCNSFYGAAMLPIIILLVIFIPANNQVFGYVDTLSYFIFVIILWIFERKRFKL